MLDRLEGYSESGAPREAYKPDVRAHRRDYEVRKISHAEASALIVEEHYARGCSNTSSETFGLFRAGVLVGAALWMPPTKPCAVTVDADNWRRVISLSRLALRPSEPTNAESIFIGAMLRTLRKERRWVAAVTFADSSQGHEGTIYKATNWTYVGVTYRERLWVDAEGRQVAKRATRTRTAAEMRAAGYRQAGYFTKHKFVYRFS